MGLELKLSVSGSEIHTVEESLEVKFNKAIRMQRELGND